MVKVGDVLYEIDVDGMSVARAPYSVGEAASSDEKPSSTSSKAAAAPAASSAHGERVQLCSESLTTRLTTAST